ncbi:phage tail sheath family protein [Streptomyces sp. FL07-04A]|uniref:phage tail sheath family protein n=1 Tax=Streptomyces sp. FL07-04A TaxID=3028658 RepID=UPI0029B165F3|nr:phage tail sheath family protein [Streptomyces sp. FL07-04A]MDX3575433.1 phage tail sheath family protein [Streptomyces sp. FL07-04A]
MPTYLSPGVYVEEAQSGSRPIEAVGTAVAAFVGFAEKGPFHEPTLVTTWSQYVQTFGDFVDGSYLGLSVYGYFANGGSVAYVVRVGGASGVGRTGEGEGPRELTAGEPVGLGSFRVAALPGVDAAGTTVEVSHPEGDNAPEDRFKLVVSQDGKTVETHDVSTRKNAKNYVVTQVKTGSTRIAVEEAVAQGALTRPAAQKVALLPAAPAPAPATAAVLPAEISPQEYIGDAAARTGFGGLEAVDEVTMVAVPDLMAAYEQGLIDAEGVKGVQLAMITHCELMGDRMAVLDPLPELTPQQVSRWRQEEAGYDSKYAALYYPWIKAFDPASGKNRLMPPSGHVVGVWSRNDGERGVHKAPANEVVRGALDLAVNVTKGEQDLLNPIGVNCIRAFPGRGIRIWGARTLSSDAAWRYINVRRLFNYLEESILLGTQWVVFEPNDIRLWGTIRRNISAFLREEWRRGALFGASAAEAFYVKCDDETNTPDSIDAGQVICEIGICPVKPAEFVVFRLSQFSDSTSLVDE